MKETTSNRIFLSVIAAIVFLAFIVGLTACNADLDGTGTAYSVVGEPEMAIVGLESVETTEFTYLDLQEPQVCNWDVFHQEEATCKAIFDGAEGNCGRVRALCTIEPELTWKDGPLRDCQASNHYWDAVIDTIGEYAPECLSYLQGS